MPVLNRFGNLGIGDADFRINPGAATLSWPPKTGSAD